MGFEPATAQQMLRHSYMTVTTETYVEVIEAVQREALNSMGVSFSVGPPSTHRSKPLSLKLSLESAMFGREVVF